MQITQMKKITLLFILIGTFLLVSCNEKTKKPSNKKIENQPEISKEQLKKIKYLEGEQFLVDEKGMTKYASKETPFITYQITSAGNALIEKLFFEQEKEMT